MSIPNVLLFSILSIFLILTLKLYLSIDYIFEADDFNLDPIVVIAQRYATKDLDTPAVVSVYTKKS
jgi:hypothetical protein